MKHYSLFIIFIIFCSCTNNQSDKIAVKPTKVSRDTIKPHLVYEYSKDSMFLYVEPANHKDPLKFEGTYYVKYKGTYKVVHEFCGYDQIWFYTDSTKSRYKYDKRGKKFLRGKKKAKFLNFLFRGAPKNHE